MFIDAHQHVWDPTAAEYDWLDDPGLTPVNRAVDYDEYVAGLRSFGGSGSVLVEAADNDEDTELMFSTAASHPEVLGIVAYIPLDRPGRATERLQQLRRRALFCGVRTLIHRQADPDWLLTPAVDEGLAMLEEDGVPFDVVGVLPRHLDVLEEVARRHPELPLVLDHLNKPDVTRAPSEDWSTAMGRLADRPNVFMKFSGLYAPDPNVAAWTVAGVRPYLRHIVDSFGSDRVMYGSDWPMCILAGGYDRVTAAQLQLIGELDDPQQADVLWRTASRFYGIEPPGASAVK